MFLIPMAGLAAFSVLQRVEFEESEGRLTLRLGGLDLGDLRFTSGEVRLEGLLSPEAQGRVREDLLRILQAGPRRILGLSRATRLSEESLLPVLEGLEKEGRVAAFPLRTPEGWTGLYALPDHASRAAQESGFERRPEVPRSLREAILEGVDRLRREFMRNPDVEEIARELGRDPEESAFRQAVYLAAGEMGWRPPTPREREEARRKMEYIPALAGLLKKGITPPDARLDEIARAREYLEGRPKPLPELKA
jgi:hypothetical protein